MIEVAKAINNFASNEAAQPSEQVFVLSSSQLQDIIDRAVEKATVPLEMRLTDLETRLDIHSQKLFNKRKTETAKQWVDDLYEAMFASKMRDITILTASRMLGCSKETIRLLIPLIAKDKRFVVGHTGNKINIVLRCYL
jgi:hypothetical protein